MIDTPGKFQNVCYICGSMTFLIDGVELPRGWTSEIYDDRGKVVFLCPSCTKLLDETPKKTTKRQNENKTKISDIRLTEKQLAVLQIIFGIDQEREAAEKNRYFKWLEGERPRKAEEWRWITYGISYEEYLNQIGKAYEIAAHLEIFGVSDQWFADDKTLKIRLSEKNLDNQGLGKIFSTLDDKQLINNGRKLHRTSGTALLLPAVRMTRRGRAFIRSRLDLKPDREGNQKMEKENGKMQCAECRRPFAATELSPGVIDDKLKLVCSDCWNSAVEAGRATVMTGNEQSTFLELE